MISYNGEFESKKDVSITNLPAGSYVGKVLGALREITVGRLIISCFSLMLMKGNTRVTM